MQHIVDIEHIKKYYGNKGNVTKAIDDISFQVNEKEFVGIMGPSGSGKTTLLNCIATIDQVTAGKIIINDHEITSLKSSELESFRRKELGFIFQDYNLLDPLTAYENIALALTIKGEKAALIDGKVKTVAEYLGITAELEKYPYQMSGGQQQRVAAARALVKNPTLILADEPTGALDSQSSQLLLEKMAEFNKQLCTTIIMVTHDAFAASYAQKILFLKDGKIFQKLDRQEKSRKEFFSDIMDIVAKLEGKS